MLFAPEEETPLCVYSSELMKVCGSSLDLNNRAQCSSKEREYGILILFKQMQALSANRVKVEPKQGKQNKKTVKGGTQCKSWQHVILNKVKFYIVSFNSPVTKQKHQIHNFKSNTVCRNE